MVEGVGVKHLPFASAAGLLVSRKCLTRSWGSGEAFPTRPDAGFVIVRGMLAPLHRYHNLGVHPALDIVRNATSWVQPVGRSLRRPDRCAAIDGTDNYTLVVDIAKRAPIGAIIIVPYTQDTLREF